jgi:hypothetical protein
LSDYNFLVSDSEYGMIKCDFKGNTFAVCPLSKNDDCYSYNFIVKLEKIPDFDEFIYPFVIAQRLLHFDIININSNECMRVVDGFIFKSVDRPLAQWVITHSGLFIINDNANKKKVYFQLST